MSVTKIPARNGYCGLCANSKQVSVVAFDSELKMGLCAECEQCAMEADIFLNAQHVTACGSVQLLRPK